MLAPEITERRLREIRRRTNLYKVLREHASMWILAACICILAGIGALILGIFPVSRAIIALAVLAASAAAFAGIQIQRQKRSNQR